MIDKLEYSEDNQGEIVREKINRTYRIYGIQLRGHIWESWAEKRSRAYTEQRRMLMAVRGTSLHVKAKT